MRRKTPNKQTNKQTNKQKTNKKQTNKNASSELVLFDEEEIYVFSWVFKLSGSQLLILIDCICFTYSRIFYYLCREGLQNLRPSWRLHHFIGNGDVSIQEKYYREERPTTDGRTILLIMKNDLGMYIFTQPQQILLMTKNIGKSGVLIFTISLLSLPYSKYA